MGVRNIPCCPHKDGMSPKTHLFFVFKRVVVKGCKGPFQLIKCLRHGFIIVLFKPFENVQLICFDQFQLTCSLNNKGWMVGFMFYFL